MESKQSIDISWKSILKILLVFFGCYIIYLIKDILIWIVFSFIISIVFEPVIGLLIKKKITRPIAALIVYTSFFILFGFFAYWMMPIFVTEIQQFTRLFPQYFEKLSPPLQGIGIEAFESMETFTLSVQDWLIDASSNIFSAIVSVFGGILSTITIFVLATFFSIEKDEVKEMVKLTIPKKREKYFFNLWERCRSKTIAWFGSRVLSGLFIALSSYIAFSIFKVKYSLALALFAGVTDFVPIIGPIFAGIIIAFFVLLDSWSKALFVIIVFILIQQIEGNIIGPISNKKLTGLPAILTLIALLIGGRLWGILGAILAVPLTGVVYEFSKDLLKRKNNF